MLNVIGRGKGAKLRIIPASGKGLRASSNIANPVPASTGWTEISPGVWQCDGVTVGAATTLILTQEADGLVIGQSYLLSATITGTADILIRSGATTLDTNWDGSPKIFIPNNGNFNIFQRAGGYTIQSIVIREAAITALGVVSLSEVGAPAATMMAPEAIGVESVSEVGAAEFIVPAAIGVESASEVGVASAVDTTAPTMTDDVYTEATTTFSAGVSEPATLHYLVTDTQPTTADDIILGTGLLKTTAPVVAGANTHHVEFSTVAAGTHWLGVIAVDAAGNSDFAEAHVAQYVFPGGYVATGVESASEVGTPEPGVAAQVATGVESASEVGAPSATIIAPAAVGVESASEVGAPDAPSGAYTPEYVDNQGSANVVLTGSFAADSVRFWVSMWVNFTNDAVSSERMFEVAGRSEISRELNTVNFLVKNTGATTILDINTPTIAKDTLTHIFFTFDGTVSTGGWTLHINGSDASGSVSTTTAWAAGTVDHTRATASVLTGVDVQQIGDLLLGANTPPALSAVYDGGPVDPAGVTATVKFVGDAAYWNANPNSYTTSGTFVDA